VGVEEGGRWVALSGSVAVEDVDVVSGRLWAAGAAGLEERAPIGPPASDGAPNDAELVAGSPRFRPGSRNQFGSLVDDDLELVAGSPRFRPGSRNQFEGGVSAEDGPVEDGTAVVELVASAPAEVASVVRSAFPDPASVRVAALDPSAAPSDPWSTGERDVVVVPGVVVRIDPGGAFGHGGHVTTRLALELVAARCTTGWGTGPDRSVLDVGTGSGVLAVAAARLGAGPVVAVDVDPRARAATRANAAANGVEVEVPDGGLDAVGGAFGLVVANLEAPVLVELGPALVARVAPEGRAVVSGFLAARVGAVVAALAPLRVVNRRTEDDWAALVLRHP
jgi:protein-L-isoaspartate O-methyltransferase